ncbi:general transcription factor 3C polypeptide 2 [Fundulus heteroclitus]|uniref:general transcription factor 3C polypeptide 2 n=1 Tax=Fundulus heteroclitus TaxID=8078 RepID=UPI00165C0A77|nr:general transcription factor 3C polypeptide 2 [Fundulus heteroclitus]
MDPVVSGEGQDKPSELSLYLSPCLKGRERKKNSKYFDFETDFSNVGRSVKNKSPRKSAGKRESSQKTPAKPRKTKTPEERAANGEKEPTPQTPADSAAPTSLVTPKKPGRRKKTQLVSTPLTTAAAAAGDLPAGEAVQTSVQQENGTPKPKRKYVRKKPVEEIREPKEEPAAEAEEEVGGGGRSRRRAAKVALKYLHTLANEVLSHPGDDFGSKLHEDAEFQQEVPKTKKGRKRKRDDREAADDEDFVPDVNAEEAEETDEEDPEDGGWSDAELDTGSFHFPRHHQGTQGPSHNGLEFVIVKTITESFEGTKKFREEHHSSWAFPEWVPSTSDWEPVPEKELEKYLPQELESPAFKVSRENLTEEETPPLRLRRFEATPAHPCLWDMFLFAGGPLWALEWCPTPDGAPASQYVALACHRGMDDLHCMNQTYCGAGLVQLWDCGKLEHHSRPDSLPSLAYGLAQDKGFIWQLKWCPAGGWELPSCVRKAPFLPRLGLLAAATSSGVVTIYSLPHPDALLSNRKLTNAESNNEKPPIYKARGVVTLKLGCIKSPRKDNSGQVLSMDWLPQKPHNIMAIGFYDGIVGLWDLSTKSSLLRVRESDRSLTLLPYRYIAAHNHAVRTLAFCPASRFLLMTAGEDRYLKTWDLRRLCDMVKVQKRHQTTEICWPLGSPGVLIAEESSFVPRASIGVHYIDHHLHSYFAIPRNTTVWSISYSDWLHSVLSSDTLGEVIISMLPLSNFNLINVKKTDMRRFPAYLTSLVPCEATEEGNKGEKEEGQGGGGQDSGETERSEVELQANQEAHEGGSVVEGPHLQFQAYKDAVKKHYLHFKDLDMRTLHRFCKRPLWKHMKNTEGSTVLNMDDMPLAALYKARFNPNMSSHVWIASGGQAGLVRLQCARTLITPRVSKLMGEHQAQFRALYSVQNQSDGVQTAPAEPQQPEPCLAAGSDGEKSNQ